MPHHTAAAGTRCLEYISHIPGTRDIMRRCETRGHSNTFKYLGTAAVLESYTKLPGSCEYLVCILHHLMVTMSVGSPASPSPAPPAGWLIIVAVFTALTANHSAPHEFVGGIDHLTIRSRASTGEVCRGMYHYSYICTRMPVSTAMVRLSRR